MVPTIEYPSVFITNKVAYGVKVPFTSKVLFRKKPMRGDIVVFKSPENLTIPYVKRIIGTPGDTITMVKGDVFINQKRITSSLNYNIQIAYNTTFADKLNTELHGKMAILKRETTAKGHEYNVMYKNEGSMRDFYDLVVPKGCYFVLGDNRDNSSDSRYWGFLKSEDIIGKMIDIPVITRKRTIPKSLLNRQLLECL